MEHPAALSPGELLRQCDETRVRRSGPGGQRRNKVETGVVLLHRPTGLKCEASERRSQAENRRAALGRLRLKLALEVRRRRPRKADDVPSPLWRQRCRSGKISINPEHDDFPTLLAEALDVLGDNDFHLPAAADVLGCSSSQLLKLLKLQPAALETLNRERAAHGLRPLK